MRFRRSGVAGFWPVITIGLVLLVIAGTLLFRNVPTPTNAGALSTSSSALPRRETQKQPLQ